MDAFAFHAVFEPLHHIHMDALGCIQQLVQDTPRLLLEDVAEILLHLWPLGARQGLFHLVGNQMVAWQKPQLQEVSSLEWLILLVNCGLQAKCSGLINEAKFRAQGRLQELVVCILMRHEHVALSEQVIAILVPKNINENSMLQVIQQGRELRLNLALLPLLFKFLANMTCQKPLKLSRSQNRSEMNLVG